MKELINNDTYKKLIDFMEKYRIKSGEDKKITHVSMGTNGYLQGKFSIPENLTELFYKYYSKSLKDNAHLFIAESPLEQGPILIDIDMKYELINNTGDENLHSRMYEKSDIELVLNIYNKAILTYLNVDEELFKTYVFEKKMPTIVKNIDGKTMYKDGFHIIYPFICASVTTQLLIREIVIDNISSNNSLVHLSLLNSYDEIFDKSVIGKNNWLLYGSSKTTNENLKYKLTHIYNFNLKCDDIESSEYDNINLIKNLSTRKFKESDKTEFIENVNEELIKQAYELMMKQKNIKNNQAYKNDISNMDVKMCSKLVGLLKHERADDYIMWRDVGFCLHNIDESLLDLWIEFSKQSPKFKEGICEKVWKTFKNSGYGMGSLHLWAKSDNLDKYIDYMMTIYDNVIMDSLYGATSGKVAKVFYSMNKYNYVCESIKFKKMYEFKNHRWQYMDESTGIINKLNNELTQYYGRLSSLLTSKASLETDEKERKKIYEKHKSALDISIKLSTMAFKNQIVAELLHMYFDKPFINKLDENYDLICFNNGVFDLKTHELREGKPEDYISMCTNVNYVPYDINNNAIKKVEQFFDDIQPDPELKHYLQGLLCLSLSGHQKEQLFPIWTGTGANGKGRTLKLALDSFGDYATTLNVSFLTQKKSSSSAANPELAKTKGKRLCVFQEPENTDKIYVGNMKSLCGGDKIEARKLYSDPFEFYPQFKMVLACNKLPTMPSNDGGTWRRIRVIPFNIKFVMEPKNENEKKINNNIDEELPKLKEAFMSILINRYKEYLLCGLKEPNVIIEQTKLYQTNSDMYAEYMNDRIKITSNYDDVLTEKDLFLDFKHWLAQDKISRDKIDKTQFINEIAEKVGKSVKGKFIGIKLKTFLDDVTESENKLNSSIRTEEASLFETTIKKKKKNNDIEKNEDNIDEIFISTKNKKSVLDV